jgi:hypothetical protein
MAQLARLKTAGNTTASSGFFSISLSFRHEKAPRPENRLQNENFFFKKKNLAL